MVGDFRVAGRQSKGAPEQALVHDFPRDALGKAIPYGVYDMAHDEAYVSVGRDHDTPAFAGGLIILKPAIKSPPPRRTAVLACACTRRAQ